MNPPPHFAEIHPERKSREVAIWLGFPGPGKALDEGGAKTLEQWQETENS